MPSTYSAGQLLIAALDISGNVSGSLSTPNGWTLMRMDVHPSSTLTKAIYYRIAAASVPNPTWTWTTSQSASGGIIAYSGSFSASAPMHTSAATSGTGTSLTAPSITNTVANAHLIVLFGTAQGVTPALVGGENISARFSLGRSRPTCYGTLLADAVQTSSGATQAKHATTSSAADWVTQSISINSATIAIYPEARLVSSLWRTGCLGDPRQQRELGSRGGNLQAPALPGTPTRPVAVSRQGHVR